MGLLEGMYPHTPGRYHEINLDNRQQFKEPDKRLKNTNEKSMRLLEFG